MTFIPVRDRTKATLNSLLRQNIAEGSVLFTDGKDIQMKTTILLVMQELITQKNL